MSVNIHRHVGRAHGARTETETVLVPGEEEEMTYENDTGIVGGDEDVYSFGVLVDGSCPSFEVSI